MSMAAENATLSLVMPNRIGTRARGRLTSCGSWDGMIHPGSSTKYRKHASAERTNPHIVADYSSTQKLRAVPRNGESFA